MSDAGITLNAFRLNTAFNHLMFTGRRGRVYDRLVSLSGVREGDTVLDVGTSSGYLAFRLAAVAGPEGQVVGVDPAEPAIAHARRRARPGMTFTVGIAQDLSLPDASFDLVTCTLALHHIPARQRRAACAEMYRVTRPGGRLLIADMAPLLPLLGGHRTATARPSSPARSSSPAQSSSPARAGGQFGDLAAAAGYRIESAGRLPLLSYLVATRPPA